LYGEKKDETASKCLDPQQKDDFAPVEEINSKMQKVKTAPKSLKQQKKETALPKCLNSKVVSDTVDGQ